MATFSFQDVTATLVGPGGFASLGVGSGASEEGITVEMAEDQNTMTIGADGSAMHSLHAGRSGTVTVRLLKTAPANAVLNAMMEVQRATSSLHGRNTLIVTDQARGDVVTCQLVAFARKPTLNYSKEGGTNEWTFHVGRIEQLLAPGS